jgi:hypothetical protein
MSAYLYYPTPGSSHVSPTSEIVVCFVEPPDDWQKKTFIKVSGQWAVYRGEAIDPFETTRVVDDDENVLWGLRLRGGMPSKSIMVQAWCDGVLTTVDDRFFVRGAKACVPSPMTTGRRLRMPGGYFTVGKNHWQVGDKRIDGVPDWLQFGRPATDGDHFFAVYPNRGRIVTWHDGEVVEDGIPEYVLRGAKAWDVGQGWVVAAAHHDETLVCTPGNVYPWDIVAKDVAVRDGWIHLDLGQVTAHLPSGYAPSRWERGLSSWYVLENPGEGQNVFSDEMFVWWNDNEMIAKHAPDPITAEFEGMRWKESDIGEAFDTVRIVDSHHVVVNDHLYLNTYTPEVIRL